MSDVLHGGSAGPAAPSARAADAIVVDHLVKSYGARRVVDDLSIRVAAGRIFGFLGPNGSGKTTTIRMLCGLLTPDSGSGTCLGLDILAEAPAIKRQVGYMTQRFSLYEDLTIRENLDFVARMYGLQGRRGLVDAALTRLGLADRQHQLAGALSGGWKQRLSLAACILHGPKLLLLDEPTAGVDPKARREFWDQIHLLAGEGMTVLVSTHYMDEAERCHEIAYIAYGKLMVQGTVGEVVAGSGLSTWSVSGERMAGLARELRARPGVDMVAAFGQTLHVSGSDSGALDEAVGPWLHDPALAWTRSKPSLEDVFIHLMSRSKDNYQ
jgi:ABC-2 type transport system ATP-binding protein